MQSKSTIRPHFTPTGMAARSKADNSTWRPECRDWSPCVAGIQKRAAAWKQSGCSSNCQARSCVWPSHPTPSCVSRRRENMSTPNFVHKCWQNVIHNSQKVEITQMTTAHDWISKIWYIYIMESRNYSGIKRNEWLLHAKNMGKPWQHYAKLKPVQHYVKLKPVHLYKWFNLYKMLEKANT